MKHNKNDSDVWIVAIKDRTPEGLLAFDLTDIIKCLAPKIESLAWIAFDVDFAGRSIVAQGELQTTSALLEGSINVEQIIDGKFIAYHQSLPMGNAKWDYAHFPASNAVIAIVAVDSSYFEVYTKNAEHVRLLKDRFSQVSDEDPSQYFNEPS